jgi:glycerol-3-phosphate dehydrogenase
VDRHWDLIIIGGGITGAGIYNLAAKVGLSVLLLEKNDFASGTSSKSSKLVHGGLRYLKQAQFALTRESVIERERLLREAPGLVTHLQFAMPIYQNSGPGKFTMDAGLSLYSLLAGKKSYKYLEKDSFLAQVPQLRTSGLKGGFLFSDAQVDDARLVLRLIFETGEMENAKALNYHRVTGIERSSSGRVQGVGYEDMESGTSGLLKCSAIINASGVWTEALHPLEQSFHPQRKKMHIRPLRGSHLVFPFWKIPVSQAVSFLHPQDGRPVFLLPWEGVTLLGTTDLDHNNQALEEDPFMEEEEQSYLLNSLTYYFPHMSLAGDDVLCSFSGLRPVLSEGGKAPSDESRESEIWSDKGLISITGGKLTTFRKLAEKALTALLHEAETWNLPSIQRVLSKPLQDFHVFNTPEPMGLKSELSRIQVQRIFGRYGSHGFSILNSMKSGQSVLSGTLTYYAELEHVVRNEQVLHLDDLMLRRTRLGLISNNGGFSLISEIRKVCGPFLGWTDEKWNEEYIRYQKLWHQSFSIPGAGSSPEVPAEQASPLLAEL